MGKPTCFSGWVVHFSGSPADLTAQNFSSYSISASWSTGATLPIRYNLSNMTSDYYIPSSGNGGKGMSNECYTSNVNYSCNNLGHEKLSNSTLKGGLSTKPEVSVNMIDNSSQESVCCAWMETEYDRSSSPVSKISKENFDMGTEFGRKETSKVQNVSFDRGCLAQSFDIYYASRESLISMGVPINNILSTNLPQSFPNEYCTPPKGWNG